MPFKDIDKRREAVRKSQQKAYAADPEKFRQKAREWAAAHPRPGSHNIKGTPSYWRTLNRLHIWKNQAKLDYIEHFGGACQCCGETIAEFLTMEHLQGGGNQDRKTFHGNIYARARKEGYPPEKYGLLCMNCNFAEGKYGYCPHKLYATLFVEAESIKEIQLPSENTP